MSNWWQWYGKWKNTFWSLSNTFWWVSGSQTCPFLPCQFCSCPEKKEEGKENLVVTELSDICIVMNLNLDLNWNPPALWWLQVNLLTLHLWMGFLAMLHRKPPSHFVFCYVWYLFVLRGKMISLKILSFFQFHWEYFCLSQFECSSDLKAFPQRMSKNTV